MGISLLMADITSLYSNVFSHDLGIVRGDCDVFTLFANCNKSFISGSSKTSLNQCTPNDLLSSDFALASFAFKFTFALSILERISSYR